VEDFKNSISNNKNPLLLSPVKEIAYYNENFNYGIRIDFDILSS
jgi:hypothetical protein